MINLVIWSKDRACQLHLLLESIKKYAPNIFKTSIIYKTSNEEYEKGYDQLIEGVSNWDNDRFNFFKEQHLKDDTVNLIDNTKFDHVCFSTDDMVIYRMLPIQDCDILRLYLPYYHSEVFSFRLGFNTIMQDAYNNRFQPYLNRYIKNEYTVHWNNSIYENTDNYGYPMAMDMHVFLREYIVPLIAEEEWLHSNSLETALLKYSNQVIYMSSFTNSVAVNIPVNNFSQITQSAQTYNYSQEYLNKIYLEGYKINLYALGMYNIIGCHQELPFDFIKDKDASTILG